MSIWDCYIKIISSDLKRYGEIVRGTPEGQLQGRNEEADEKLCGDMCT